MLLYEYLNTQICQNKELLCGKFHEKSNIVNNKLRKITFF